MDQNLVIEKEENKSYQFSTFYFKINPEGGGKIPSILVSGKKLLPPGPRIKLLQRKSQGHQKAQELNIRRK